MAISFVASASENNTSITTMPTHQKGDMLVFVPFRFGSNTSPTVPAGNAGLSIFGSNNQSVNVHWRIAASSSETSGTWTNASALACLVYRIDPGEFLGVVSGSTAAANPSTTTVTLNYSSFWPLHITGSWYIFAAMTNATDSTIDAAPSGFTARETRSIAATGEWVVADTNGDPTSRPNISYSIGGTASAFRSFGAKLNYYSNYPSGGSGGVPLIGAGGLVY